MNARHLVMTQLQRVSALPWIARRLWLVTPAEHLLLQIMGGRSVTVSTENGLPLIFVWWLPRLFRREKVRHSVTIAGRHVSFGNDIRRGISFDGAAYRNDIIVQQELDDHFQSHGWRVLHIVGSSLQRDPRTVRRDVRTFLTS